MQESKGRQMIYMILAFALMIVVLFPYFVMVITAFKPGTEVYNLPSRFLPKEWTLTNFVDIWTAIPLASYFINTFIVAIGATLLTLLCALPAAYVLARMKFKGRRFYMYLVLVSQMFSPIVLLVGIYREINFLGLIDTVWALVLANAAFNQAFAVWLLSGYFSTIPYELEQAAWLDGCTRFQALRRVVLPLAVPGLITTVIFVFIASWNEFVLALTLISSDASKPLTVGVFAFFGKFDVQWQYLFATSLFATIPVVALFLLIEKYLVSGLTSGGVKD
jgi:multiple sugar transport system permease protein